MRAQFVRFCTNVLQPSRRNKKWPLDIKFALTGLARMIYTSGFVYFP